MNKVFVFDLDDTLMTNVHDYAEPILDMARVIIRRLGPKAPHVSAVIALEEEIDKRRVHEVNPETGNKFFYSMERFPGTLVETYRAICRKAKVEPEMSVEVELFDIGYSAFDTSHYKNNIDPKALQTIEMLVRKRDIVMILTKGDSRVQINKLAALKASKLLKRVKIVSDKTPQTFKEILEDFGAFDCYSVGNDYEKDIVPAFEAGCHGVFIPVETWEVIGRMDEILAKVDRSRCLVLNNLGEIIERYGEL